MGTVLVLVTGSVAAITVPELCTQLLELHVPQKEKGAQSQQQQQQEQQQQQQQLPATKTAERATHASEENTSTKVTVRVAATKSGLHFLASDATARRVGLTVGTRKECEELEIVDRARKALPRGVELFVDEDEWAWQERGDDVLHISLRKWADVLVVAPLDANTLAKIAHGLCDNLATSIIRAWDFNKPIFVAPAMNTAMWDHPITKQQLMVLEQYGIISIPPVAKRLECGDSGTGAMASTATITHMVCDSFAPGTNIAERASFVERNPP